MVTQRLSYAELMARRAMSEKLQGYNALAYDKVPASLAGTKQELKATALSKAPSTSYAEDGSKITTEVPLGSSLIKDRKQAVKPVTIIDRTDIQDMLQARIHGQLHEYYQSRSIDNIMLPKAAKHLCFHCKGVDSCRCDLPTIVAPPEPKPIQEYQFATVTPRYAKT